MPLNSIVRPDETFNEVSIVEYVSSYLKFWGTPRTWIDDIIEKYKEEALPPQLSIASWIVASMCTHILFNIATKKEYKKFPEFYLSTLMND